MKKDHQVILGIAVIAGVTLLTTASKKKKEVTKKKGYTLEELGSQFDSAKAELEKANKVSKEAYNAFESIRTRYEKAAAVHIKDVATTVSNKVDGIKSEDDNIVSVTLKSIN